jgi:TolB-like protein
MSPAAPARAELPPPCGPAAAGQPGSGKAPRRPIIAVLYFDYTGRDEALAVLAKGLAQMLISDLAAVDGACIVERERLQALLDEMKLSRGSHFDARTASRVGRLLGARYVVLGNYLDLLGMLRINADLVDVETGVHAAGTSAVGKPEEFLALEQKLSAALAQAIATRLPAPVDAGPPSALRPSGRAGAKPPARLPLKTAVQYAKALDAQDRGDRTAATAGLQAVVQEQPDFALATGELERLMR